MSEPIREVIDDLFMEHGVQLVLQEVANWLKEAGQSDGGSVGTKVGTIIEQLADWEW